MANQQVIVSILADTTKFNSAMGKTDTTLTRFSRALQNVNRVGVLAFTGLAYAASRFTIEAVKSAEEAEAIDRKLQNQARNIKTLGDNYLVVTNRLVKLAEEQQKLLGVDDDLIKQVDTLLLTFPDLAKTATQVGGAFDRATLAAFNLAEMGIGTAEGNAIQLGKALEDPVKGITSLTKSGITFSKQQREQIKQWAESGQKAKAYSYILGVIETQSANAGVVGVTASQKLATSWDAFIETFGKKLLPKLVPVIESLTTALDDLAKNPDLDAFVQSFADAIADVAKELPKVITGLTDLLKWMKKNNITFLDATAAVIGFQAALGGLQLVFPSIISYFQGQADAQRKAGLSVKSYQDKLDDLVMQEEHLLGVADDNNEARKLADKRLAKGTITTKQYKDEIKALNKEQKLLNTQFAKNSRLQKIATAGLKGGPFSGITMTFQKMAMSSGDLLGTLGRSLKLLGRFAGVVGLVFAAFDVLKGVWQGFTETLDGLLGGKGKGMDGLIKMFESLQPLLDAISTVLGAIGYVIGTVIALAVAGIIKSVEFLVGLVKALAGWWATVTGASQTYYAQQNAGKPVSTIPGSTTPTVKTPNLGNNMAPVTYNVNVSSLVPTAETGRVITKSIQQYQRTGGRAVQ